MNNYEITLKNRETDQLETSTVQRICFAEAAQQAYMIRSKLGHSWKITSIEQKGETKKCQN